MRSGTAVLVMACLLHVTPVQAQVSATPRFPIGTVPAGPGLASPDVNAPLPSSTPVQPGNPETQPREGAVRWLGSVVASGQEVLIRLRGEAFSAILNPQQRWQLVAVGAHGQETDLAANLVLPLPVDEQQAKQFLRQVPVTLGTMRANAQTGQSIWPLMGPDPRLPLAKLKLTAEPVPAGPLRLVQVARLGTLGQVDHVLAADYWDPSTAEAGSAVSSLWLAVPPSVVPDQWGIAVHDGQTQPLQLRGVKAFANELALRCHLTGTRDVRLRLQPATPGQSVLISGIPQSPPVAGPIPQITSLPMAGEIAELRIVVTPPTGPRPAGGDSLLPRLVIPGWAVALAWGTAGLLLLMLGWRLIHSGQQLVD